MYSCCDAHESSHLSHILAFVHGQAPSSPQDVIFDQNDFRGGRGGGGGWG